jgi:secondary thiamine-phosphate synthase enzyme
VETSTISVHTGRHAAVVDITDEVVGFVVGRGSGLVNVFVPHATAGVAIMETGAGSEEDLLAALSRLLPRNDRWRHRHGSQGHGADHVLPAFIAPGISIPVIDGRPAFGTWQSVVLVDPNEDNPDRTIRLSWLPA